MTLDNRIKDFREKIDRLDDQLIDIIVERLSLTLDIGEIKEAINLNITDNNREQEIINRMTQRLNGRLNPKEIEKIFNLIFQISKKLQKKNSFALDRSLS